MYFDFRIIDLRQPVLPFHVMARLFRVSERPLGHYDFLDGAGVGGRRSSISSRTAPLRSIFLGEFHPRGRTGLTKNAATGS